MFDYKPKLGETAYAVNADGSISRTFVSVLKKDGTYDVFNAGTAGKYKFNFLEASRMSADILKEKKKSIQAELQKVNAQLLKSGSLEHKQEVDASKIMHPHNATGFLANKKASMPAVPENHIMPGELAYVVVTPHNIFFLKDAYKSPLYAIIQVEVSAAALLAGLLNYETDIFYRAFPATTFTDLPAAKEKLAQVFTDQTGSTLAPEQMKVVSHSEMLIQKGTTAGLQQSPSGAYLTNELDSPAFRGD